MTKYRKNEITVWSKTNHIHYCAVFLKAKDVANFIRQYLFLRLDFSGEYYSEQTLRGSIVALTDWDAEVITNAIAKLKKSGEIERINSNHYRFNPDIANRYRFGFRSKYQGSQPVYDSRQQKLIDSLEKQTRHTRPTIPQSQHEMYAMEEAEQKEIETMVALRKIDELTLEVRDLKAMIADLVQHIVTQPEIPDQIKLVAKRKLALVAEPK
jgi:hypothetical protein